MYERPFFWPLVLLSLLILPIRRADFSFEDVTDHLLSWLVKVSVLPPVPPPDPAGFILAMEQTDVSSQGYVSRTLSLLSGPMLKRHVP